MLDIASTVVATTGGVVATVIAVVKVWNELRRKGGTASVPASSGSVRITSLTTEGPGEISTPKLVRMRGWRLYGAIACTISGLLLPFTDSIPLPLRIGFLVEFVLVGAWCWLQWIGWRDSRPPDPALRLSATAVVEGERDVVFDRVVQAMQDLSALRSVGTAITTDEKRCVVQGGTGQWPHDGAGYKVTVTIEPGEQPGHCDVEIESANLIASPIQGFINRRNVQRVLAHLT